MGQMRTDAAGISRRDGPWGTDVFVGFRERGVFLGESQRTELGRT